jgi:hypothetical protein
MRLWWAAHTARLRDPRTGLPPVGEVAAAGWTSAAAVEAALGSPPLDVADSDYLALCAGAANALVARLRPDLPVPASDDPGWWYEGVDPVIALGATTLAQRWFTRRSGADAVFTGEFGAATLPAIDSDLQQLLGLGRHFGPRVA